MPDASAAVYEPGVSLNEEQKGAIMSDVAEQKKSAKEQADKIIAAKKSAALGIAKPAEGAKAPAAAEAEAKKAGGERADVGDKAPAGVEGGGGFGAAVAKGSAGEKGGEKAPSGFGAAVAKAGGSGETSEPATPRPGPVIPAKAASGGGMKAALALSPDGPRKGKAGGKDAAAGKEKDQDKDKEGAGKSAAGGAVKAVQALKGKGKGKEGAKAGGGAKKGGAKKKKAVAADEGEVGGGADAAEAGKEEEKESPEQLAARMAEEGAAREAERERLYKEREEQRAEIEAAIIAEERRVREKEARKREKERALKKLEERFREAAFDDDMEFVKKTCDEWVDECFGATLIGAKIDAVDEHKHTALSEAACGGATEICRLLLKHGAQVNSLNAQQRTPLWRAAFKDHRETVALLLAHGADPRIANNAREDPAMVAPSAELKELFAGWDVERTDELLAERAKMRNRQWIPPPPDPADLPAGEPGYCVQIGLPRLADALDSVTDDSDRPALVLDLGGKALTYFSFRDVNMICYARSADVEPECVRKKLLGALRFGKPLVLDMMSLTPERQMVAEIFEPVLPGLLDKLLRKEMYKEGEYVHLIAEGDDPEYRKQCWAERTTAHFQLVLLSKNPTAPEWAAESFFVIRVAGG